MAWTIESVGDGFERFLCSLPEYERSVALAAVRHVLAVKGIEVCAGDWGKPLGRGLYEFRVRKSLAAIMSAADQPLPKQPGMDRPVLLRMFCAFHDRTTVVLIHGYDKQRDPSERRQQREIARARAMLEVWARATER